MRNAAAQSGWSAAQLEVSWLTRIRFCRRFNTAAHINKKTRVDLAIRFMYLFLLFGGQVTSQEPFLTTGSFPGASQSEPRFIFHFLEHNYCSLKWWRGITLNAGVFCASGANWPNKSLLTFTTCEQLFLRLFRQEYADSSQKHPSRSGRGSHPFILMRCTCHTSTRVGWLRLAWGCQSLCILIHCHYLSTIIQECKGVERPPHTR